MALSVSNGGARAQDPALPLAPYHVAEQFTGFKGKYVKLADTIRGFQEIVNGKHDALPEQAFYMVGTIEEALEKAEQLKRSAA